MFTFMHMQVYMSTQSCGQLWVSLLRHPITRSVTDLELTN